MRIAIAGKGGSGKTTIAGTLARVLAQSGRPVVAIDADTNPNLSMTLGVPADAATRITSLPRSLMTKETQPDGTVTSRFTGDALAVLRDYGTVAPDNIQLLVMGAVGHAGVGCMCGAHATVRGLLGELASGSALDASDLIVDMEAGLEHMSRGTGRHVSSFIAVLEPYYRSMETVRRISELAAELGIGDVQVVTNKVRNDEDRTVLGAYCAAHNLRVIGEIPYDTSLLDAERAARPPVDFAPDSPAVNAVRALAAHLTRVS